MSIAVAPGELRLRRPARFQAPAFEVLDAGLDRVGRVVDVRA